MKCPHLSKWVTFSCKANEKVYFPTDFQLEEYCKKREHKKCPFLLSKASAREEWFEDFYAVKRF